jgi:ribosomal-protein-alanine N-acetyltransferase
MSDSTPSPDEPALVDNRPSLETDRLLLRPFASDDVETVYRLVNDPEIVATTRTLHFPYPEGAAVRWIAQQPEAWLTGRAAIFAITLKRTGLVLGAIGLEIDAADERAELGYWLDPAFWNRGYASEAAEAVVEFGFRRLGLNRLTAEYMVHNPASGRVLEKARFQPEGVLRQHARKWGRFYDVAAVGLLREDWLKSAGEIHEIF